MVVLVSLGVCFSFLGGYSIGSGSINKQDDFARVTITGTVTDVQTINYETHVTLDTFVGDTLILPGGITPEIGKRYSFNFNGADLYLTPAGIRVMARVELEEIE